MNGRSPISRYRSTVIVACVATILSGAQDQSRAPQWVNADGITAADKAAIGSLARRAGIPIRFGLSKSGGYRTASGSSTFNSLRE